MSTVVQLCKADKLSTRDIEDTIIEINDSMPKEIENIELWYETQANDLADVLFKSLPQGTLERLLIALMENKVSLYRGKTR